MCNLSWNLLSSYIISRAVVIVLAPTTMYYSLQGRELFMRMLEVFVLKFKTIAEIQMPMLLQKW